MNEKAQTLTPNEQLLQRMILLLKSDLSNVSMMATEYKARLDLVVAENAELKKQISGGADSKKQKTS